MAQRAPKFRFTPAFIKGLKKAEPGKRYYRWCDSKPHFAIRVTDNGAKAFIVVARRAGQYHPHTHVIGPCAEWTINDALEQVDGIIAQLRQGKNPKHEVKRSADDVFEKAVVVFLTDRQSEMRPTPYYQLKGDLRRSFLGQHRERTWNKERQAWESKCVQERDDHFRRWSVLQIKRRDIVRRLDEIKSAESVFVARHAMAAIRNFFNWASDGERFGVVDNPAARLTDDIISKSLSKKLKRSRVGPFGRPPLSWDIPQEICSASCY